MPADGVGEVRRLAQLTSPEVEARMAEGFDTALVVLGAIEQHGPHLPAATDSIIGEVVADRVAAELGGTLIAPIIPIGCSAEHREFAGTISLRQETLASLIEDVCRSLVEQGFRWIVVISWHGGNDRALALAREGLGGMIGSRIWCQPQLDAGLQVNASAARALGVDAARAGAHAGHAESSIMLAISPGQVRLDQLARGFVGDLSSVWHILTSQGLRPVTANGVLGDPNGASGRDGFNYLDAHVSDLTMKLRDWRGH